MLQYKSSVNKTFEDKYLAVRKKEGRIYASEQVKKLPEFSGSDILFKEWQIRKKTADKFIIYLKNNSKLENILEIGCGNGWFCNYIAQNSNVKTVTGTDINEFELKQAAEVFDSPKLNWIYADVLSDNISEKKFDLIVFNGSIQYFSDLKRIIARAKEMINANGEIHLIDSPFYNSEKEKCEAKKRTEKYYSQLGFAEMSVNYTPHLYSEALKLKMKLVFRPALIKKLTAKLLKKIPRPFPWLVLK